MPHDWLDRQRIHRRAKAMLGLKQNPDDQATFMQQCIDQIQSEGLVDNDEDAETICQLLWEEGADADEFGD